MNSVGKTRQQQRGQAGKQSFHGFILLKQSCVHMKTGNECNHAFAARNNARTQQIARRGGLP